MATSNTTRPGKPAAEPTKIAPPGAPAPGIHKDGRARCYPTLSCVTFDATAGYEAADIDYFGVPAEDYGRGNLTGAKVAWELFRTAKETGEDFDCFLPVIDAAVNVKRSERIERDCGRLGAAVGFLSALEDVLIAAAQTVDFAAVVKESMYWHERSVATELKEERASNAAFIRSMEAPTSVEEAGR